MNIRALLHRLVGDKPAGKLLLLEAFNYGRKNQMSMQVLTNKLNHNNTAHNMNVDELDLACKTLNLHLPLAEYHAAEANAVVFVLPDIGESDMALLDGFMQITKELGDVGMKFQQAYADGNIDCKDEKAISKEIDEAVAALLAWKERIKGMRRG